MMDSGNTKCLWPLHEQGTQGRKNENNVYKAPINIRKLCKNCQIIHKSNYISRPR